MKKLYAILIAILISASVFTQTPQKMSYQAVIRNTSGVLVQSSNVGMRISILQGSDNGTVVYTETQTPTTNVNGLVSIEIGGGAGFDAINWSNNSYFIKTEIDPSGGTNYTIIGASQLLSVPYALHSKTTENGFSGNYIDLTNKPTLFDAQYNSLTGLPTLFDGNYNSLTNKPSLFNGQYSNLTGIPTYADVATSGSYNNLIDKPTLFDGLYNSLTGKPTTIEGYGITDAMTTVHAANGITATNITNWTTAYGWGTHSGLYRPISYVPEWSEITSNPFNVTLPSNNQLLKYNSSTSKWENWTSDFLTTEVDGSITNEIQTLSISNDIISLTTGGNVRLPDIVRDVRILNDSLFITFSYGQVINAGYVGNGKPGSGLSSVVTVNVTDLSYTSTIVNANITDNGNEFILTRGVCLSRNAAPDLNDTVYFAGSGSGSFTVNCNLLTPNTTYYVRAFATNTVGTTYGNELSFVTKALTVPTITTQVISNITNTTAISGGNITDDGGTPILVRGICWSLSPNPTTANNFVTEGVGAGSYIALMTGLTSGTLYYIRSYATNAQGTSYGDDLSFTTIVYQLATVSTTSASGISYTTATSGGNVTNDNGSSVTSRGICWATTDLPTTANSNYTQAGGLGSFTAGITGLITNTLYFVRAFAVNGGGTSYGNQVSFTTLSPSVPSLTTKAISGISSNLAGSGGVISADGGSAITAKGVCWSLNPTPTLANSYTTDGTGTASYNSAITGLNPLTLYYVRAYATNGLGTAYGNEFSFTTTDLVNPGPTVPVVGTSTSTITGSSTASSGGYVSSDGGSTVTMRGVCWNTSANPTLSNNYSVDGGSGLGYFTSTINGLSGCGTVYYVRAYATNSTGTGYGNQNTVSTGLLPVVVTNEITSISYYTAVSGGSITDDGGCPITQKGVCWSYNPTPTIDNSKTTEGAGSSVFVSNITGLFANRTYYVRAYATNSVGTTYGAEKVFTTATPSTPYIGQNYAGGIIFYLDGTGEHGLVCASINQGNYVWGCQGTSIPTGTVLGTGTTNTAAIVASCGESNTAAKICDNLVLNSYSDWFLPSKDELTLMYTNLYTQGLGSLSGFYWTSSQRDASWSWMCIFSNGATYDFPKGEAYGVRAVRAF